MQSKKPGWSRKEADVGIANRNGRGASKAQTKNRDPVPPRETTPSPVAHRAPRCAAPSQLRQAVPLPARQQRGQTSGRRRCRRRRPVQTSEQAHRGKPSPMRKNRTSTPPPCLLPAPPCRAPCGSCGRCSSACRTRPPSADWPCPPQCRSAARSPKCRAAPARNAGCTTK